MPSKRPPPDLDETEGSTDDRVQVRMTRANLERFQHLIKNGWNGLTTTSKFVDAAVAHYGAIEEEKYRRFVAWQEWEKNGRKGPPPFAWAPKDQA